MLVFGGAAGCGSGPRQSAAPPTSAQWSALETREVDGQRDDVLRAAGAVVLDRGYFYLASDHEAGLLTGARVSSERQEFFQRTGGMRGPGIADTVGVWVRQMDAKRTQVRVQMKFGGHRTIDEQQVTAFCAAVERRLMGGEAAPLGTAPGVPPAADGASDAPKGGA